MFGKPLNNIMTDWFDSPWNWIQKSYQRIFSSPAPEVSLHSANIDVSPLKFSPRDAGFFSNFNFLIGEMYASRIVYPLFSAKELPSELKHFPYFDKNCENSWFEFFEPIRYSPDDNGHVRTEWVSTLPGTWGDLAGKEFKFPAETMKLYNRIDFPVWRQSVHDAIADKIQVAKPLRQEMNRMLAKMPAERIGVHVRHPSHMVEQGKIYFQDYFSNIDRILKQYPSSRIFLATDNDLAIAAFKMRYGEIVFYYPGFIRQSIDDILDWTYALTRSQADDMGFIGNVGFQTHYKLAAAGGGKMGIQSGKEAVLDVFTLATCDDFVCTASNFTLTSSFMNPKQRLHLISKGA